MVDGRALLLLLWMSWGCDAGSPVDEGTVGPPVEIIGVNVGRDAVLPFDGVIGIGFNRYLLPSSVNRQSFFLLDASGMPLGAAKAPIVVYDPVARTVTLNRPSDNWLTEGLTYSVVVAIPESDADPGGIRAIDRATLRSDGMRRFTFRVGPKAKTRLDELDEPAVTLCRDVLPIFAAKCSLPTCHGGGVANAASLSLDSSASLSRTALNRIAQGSNTGGRAGSAPSPGRVFGVDMPIIDPGSPGNSWLMYKVELSRPPVLVASPGGSCSKGVEGTALPFNFRDVVPQMKRAADDGERAILSNFILGLEMPFPVDRRNTYGSQALTFEERQKVRLWIKGLTPGVALPECGVCDGGASR